MPRKKIIPTEEQRLLVRRMAANGMPLKHIRIKLGIPSINTLRHYFHRDITKGRIMGKFATLSAQFKQARSGKNLAATLRWLKGNADWSKHMVLEAAKNHNPKIRNS